MSARHTFRPGDLAAFAALVAYVAGVVALVRHMGGPNPSVVGTTALSLSDFRRARAALAEAPVEPAPPVGAGQHAAPNAEAGSPDYRALEGRFAWGGDWRPMESAPRCVARDEALREARP